MKLSWYLDQFQKKICPEKGMLRNRAFNMTQGTKVSLVVSVVVALLAVADGIAAKSYLDASLNIRVVSAILSAVFAQGVFVYRRANMGQIIGGMMAVAQEIETNVNLDTQALLEHVAKRCRRLHRVYTAYSVMVCQTVLFPTLTTGNLSLPVWPKPQSFPQPRVAMAVMIAFQ
ncbi:Odorant receptor 41, partial [Frankliniella occidentalis]